jgi:hypothetical protein
MMHRIFPLVLCGWESRHQLIDDIQSLTHGPWTTDLVLGISPSYYCTRATLSTSRKLTMFEGFEAIFTKSLLGLEIPHFSLG